MRNTSPKNLQFPPTHSPAKKDRPAFDQKPRSKNWYMQFNWGPIDKNVKETGDWMSMKFVSQKLQENRNKDKSFFLACGIYRPHVPWSDHGWHFGETLVERIKKD